MNTFQDLVAYAQAGLAAANKDNLERARAYYAHALAVAHALREFRLQAALFDRLGQALDRSGEVQDAVIAFESGLRALAAADDNSASAAAPGDLDSVLDQLSAVSKQFGDYRQLAVPDLYSAPAADDLVQAANDPLLAVRLLLHTGNAYFRQPQDGPALNAYTLGLSRPEVGQAPLLRGYLLANMGEIHRRRGLLTQAHSELQEAIQLLDAHGDPREKRRALALLAGIARDQGESGLALDLYRQALELYAQTDDTRGHGRAYAGLGHLQRQLRRLDAAQQAYEHALTLATQTGDQDTLWHVHWGLGFCHQAAGRLDEAAASLRAALQLIEAHHQDLRTDEGKVTFLDSVRTVYDQLIEVHLARAPGNVSAYQDLLQVAEEARGRSLRDLLGSQQRYRPAVDENQFAPPQADDETFFNPAAQMAPGVFSAPRTRLAGEPDPAFTPERQDGPPPPPLPRLVYHVLDSQTVVLAVAADGAVQGHVVAQGREEIAARVAHLRHSLDVDGAPRGIAVQRHIQSAAQSAAPQDPLPLLTAFFADLVEPVASYLPPDGSLLVIEPHTSLWLLPFAALRDAQGRWMADRWPLLYSPSAAVLDEIRAEPGSGEPAAANALIAGNPVMPSVPAQDGLNLTLAPLPGAEQEANAVAALFDEARRTLLLGTAADRATIETQASHYTILHLATHGIAYSDDPLASFVALAEPPDGDGLLTVRRVLALAHSSGLPADLVTLSACQTGLGKVSGDGMIGLSRSFLVAGARTVLVSQWSVSDLATAQLMESFYRHYLAQENKPIALQRAMAALRQDATFAHPRYWSAFCMVGAEV